MRSPHGAVIAVFGPDGSGKSTVIRRITSDLRSNNNAVEVFHLRPRISGKKGRNDILINAPHERLPRGRVLCVAKIFYFLIVYSVGWWMKVRPLMVDSTLVIFDRYYHDILVDPRRYRYGGPMWLALWGGRLIPKPDLWVLLDAPAEVLQARKQEVPFAETARQQKEYLKFFDGLNNGVVVDASQPLKNVVADVNKAVLTLMAERTRRRLGFRAD